MTDCTVTILLERVQQSGDEQAWRQFLELTMPMLFSWTRRMELPDQDATDLVQDVLTILVQVLPTFKLDRKKNFLGWLRTVMLNRWRAQCRRRPLEPWAPDDPRWRHLRTCDAPEPFWEVEDRRQLAAQALELMQAKFQPKTWTACWEQVVSGRSAADVAEQLGMTVGAVYVAKCRVLQRLRSELNGLAD